MIQLPTEKTKPLHRNPRTMLVFSKPKQGKTTIFAQLENGLIIDTEKDGSAFVEALKINVNNFTELREAATAIYMKGTDDGKKPFVAPYKFLIVDTLTRIDEWSELDGTFKYMDKPQGQKFNRVGGISKGTKLDPNHPEFETVHEIGMGYGYKYSREAVVNFFESFNNLAPHVIYSCHVKDKLVGTTNTGGEVYTKEINLTGKLKDIIASKVDAIAYFRRDKDKGLMSFQGDEGTRAPHLSGKEIVISEKLPDETIKTYWDKVFLK